MINVSWADAVAYCEWLSTETGKLYRLPSEAESEYACRAGTTTARWWGDGISYNRANFRESGSEWSGERTSPVDTLDPNPFGLHDMLGNVWEWVEDCWHEDYTGAPTDGSAWLEANDGHCGRRVLRGGSWFIKPLFVRSAVRYWSKTDSRKNDMGFRLAQDIE